jgi:hypothetical protein
MSASVTLLIGMRRRMAFPFVPRVVRGLIPPHTIGAYLLVRDARPVYVGRSDHCLRCRLSDHELLGSASHFFWEPFRDAVRAFHFEAIWFHRLSGMLGFLNRAHPARPSGHTADCPFCDSRDALGLAVALRA